MSKLIMRDGFIDMLLVGNNYEKMSDMMRIRNSRSFQGHWRSYYGRLNFQMFCIFAREREREREFTRCIDEVPACIISKDDFTEEVN